jgi:hypothetical protein
VGESEVGDRNESQACFETELAQRLSNLGRLEKEAQALIDRLQKALETLPPPKPPLRYRLRHRFKMLLGIRAGILFQHNPKSLSLPTHYEHQGIPAIPPTICVVTPSYNQAKYLTQTLRSVLDQDYPKLEYVVQDGGSRDESPKILEQFGTRLTYWESKRDGGQSQAINLGFHHTTGEIMAYLNSDDLLLPGSLNYVADYFAKHPEVDAVYGHRILINEEGDEIGRWVLPPHDSKVLTWADYIPQETLFWRRRIWDRVGGKIDESFQFAMDWDLLLRFQQAKAKIVRLPRFLGAFRVHAQQKTLSQRDQIGDLEMARLRERCHGRRVRHDEISAAVFPFLLKQAAYHRAYQLGLFRY